MAHEDQITWLLVDCEAMNAVLAAAGRPLTGPDKDALSIVGSLNWFTDVRLARRRLSETYVE